MLPAEVTTTRTMSPSGTRTANRSEFTDRFQGTTLDFPRGKSTKGGNLWGIWTQSDDVGEVSELLVVYNDNN